MAEGFVKPALSAAEWAEYQCAGVWVDDWFGPAAEGNPPSPDRAHRAAAVALYGRPFGFTQEDVKAIRSAIGPVALLPDSLARLEAIERALAKIAALLPPEETP